MPKEKIIHCPYYETSSRSNKVYPTITCSPIENNLGFDIRNQVVFSCHEEKHNYIGIFCADQELYSTCPYYRAIYKYQKGDQESEKENRIKEAGAEGGNIVKNRLGSSAPERTGQKNGQGRS